MKVELSKTGLVHIKTMDQIIEDLRQNTVLTTEADIIRCFKSIIRNNHWQMHCENIILEITVPLFMYNELKYLYRSLVTDYIICLVDNVVPFETCFVLEESEQVALQSIFKKVSTCIKSSDIDKKNLKYYLPLSTSVQATMVLNWSYIFDLLYRCHINTSELHLFGVQVYELLNEKYPLIFSEQNLRIYMAHKENL